MSHVYRVPGIVEVVVADDVRAPVLESIEFHLGYFRVADGRDGDLPRINLSPYARFVGGGKVQFHLLHGETGVFLHAPERRHATRRTAAGFDVFSDTPEVPITMLVQILALRRGMTLLHSAGWVDPQGNVTLVPGPGGVGKTALLSAAVLRHGAKLLGDDLVLVGAEGRADPFPRAFVLKDYHRALFPQVFASLAAERQRRDRWRPLVSFVRENAPFHGVLKHLFKRAGRLEEASLWLQAHAEQQTFHTVPVRKLFGPDRIGVSGKIRQVVYVERCEGVDFHLARMTAPAAAQRSLAVLHHEWTDYWRWFCSLGAIDLIDVGTYFRDTEAAMKAAFQNADVSLLQVPTRATPEELEAAFADRLGFGGC